MPRGDEEYDAVVRLLRDTTDDINAPLFKYGVGVEHEDTHQGAVFSLRRRELEDEAIRAVRELVMRVEGEWER